MAIELKCCSEHDIIFFPRCCSILRSSSTIQVSEHYCYFIFDLYGVLINLLLRQKCQTWSSGGIYKYRHESHATVAICFCVKFQFEDEHICLFNNLLVYNLFSCILSKAFFLSLMFWILVLNKYTIHVLRKSFIFLSYIGQSANVYIQSSSLTILTNRKTYLLCMVIRWRDQDNEKHDAM